MENFDYSWRMANYVFHLACNDIFDLDVEALVNSEQTDFVLASNFSSIGGQIRERYSWVQDELDKVTGGQKKDLGTVLKTFVGGEVIVIYHAGFHDPTIFLDPDSDTDQTEHLKIIRKCYRLILNDFLFTDLSSIAFPLLGSGLFHLDPGLVAIEFFDQFVSIPKINPEGSEKHIWLVEKDPEKANIMMQAIVQRLIDLAVPANSELLGRFDIGIGYLNQFEGKFYKTSDKNWLRWLMVRYFELFVATLLSILAAGHEPKLYPKDLIKPDKPISFGTYRTALLKVAKKPYYRTGPDSLEKHLATMINRSREAKQIMEQINSDRNNIAHGKESRDPIVLEVDIQDFIAAIDWKNLRSSYPLPSSDSLIPWIRKPDMSNNFDLGTDDTIGIIEEWKADKYEYIIPHMGEEFQIEY